MRQRILPLLLLVGSLVSGCEAADDQVLSVAATGSVAGVVFLDRDGDQKLTPDSDGPVPGMKVTLLLRGTPRAVAHATTDAGGGYRMPLVPVGRYQISLDSASLGDSLRVIVVEPADLVVSSSDSSLVLVGVTRTSVSVADARKADPGRRVLVEGIALNGSVTYGDSTVHIADASGTIRAVQVGGPAVAAGDSVRVLGTIGSASGRPALTEAEILPLGRGRLPAPVPVSTTRAASGDGGALDGGLVRVTGATITGLATTATGDLRLQVDDDSGMLEVLLDRSTQIASESPLLPGARVDVTGLLVPARGEGVWSLKPRMSADLEATVPQVSLAELRQLPRGRLVSVEAIALHGVATFGDGTLHVADPTGAALTVGVPSAFVFAGDRVRLIGVVGGFNGHTALSALEGIPPTVLKRDRVPPPSQVTTAVAATAKGEELDAALVQVSGATVTDTATIGMDFLLQVDDGSGPLEVFLDDVAGLSSSVHAPGAVLDITGLLVPQQGGRAWFLRPRSRADLVRK